MKELKLAGVASIEAANAYLGDAYLPVHNQRFAGRAGSLRFGLHADSGRRSRRDPVRAGRAPGDERQLRVLPHAEAADSRTPDAAAFRQARVKVHPDPDGSYALFHGPRCIGRYDENGATRDAKHAA